MNLLHDYFEFPDKPLQFSLLTRTKKRTSETNANRLKDTGIIIKLVAIFPNHNSAIEYVWEWVSKTGIVYR
jgi:hypothetical protein